MVVGVIIWQGFQSRADTRLPVGAAGELVEKLGSTARMFRIFHWTIAKAFGFLFPIIH
jgi:hypothetical protein